MGVCFGRKKNDRYSFQIQAQINNTVKEQEDMQMQESLELKQQKHLDDDEITIKITQSQQILVKDQNDEAITQQTEIKESKHKKRKKKQKDENYLKQVEYNISLKSTIIEEEQDQNRSQYNITFVVQYMEYNHNVAAKGVLINHPKKTFQIVPNTFEEAAKHARFNPFFSTDTYFNINQDSHNHTNYFEKLLHVERTIQTERQLKVQTTKRLSRRASSIGEDFQSPSPLKKRQNLKKNEFISELLEVVQIFDLEAQPRFQQILFFLALREQRPELKSNFISIEELVVLFERLPTFDQPNVYRLAIFYENLDYNLHDLIVYMQHEQLQLSHICYLKIAHDLIQAFHNCYSNYCYRINFTLSSIFYSKRSKKIKIQSFCRLQTLIPFEGDINLHIKNVSEQKLKFFVRSFKKDIAALCDLLLYLKNINKNLEDIQQYRKFAKTNSSLEYIQYSEQMLDPETEKNIYELIRFSLDEIEFRTINQFITDIYDQVTSIEQIISELEIKVETDKKIAKQPKPFTAYEKSLSESDDNINEIDNLDLGMNMNSLPEFNKTQKVTELKCQYKELLYSSLFLNYRFQQNCISYLSNKSDTLHQVHAQILYSLLQIDYEEKEYEISIKQQIKYLQKSIEQAVAHPIDRQDPFHYYVLLHLLTLTEEKPFSLIIQLQRLMEAQQKIKKEHVKPKLKQNHAFGGKIEMRKAVYLQIFFAENLIYKHNYSQALHCMQRIITWQLKQNLKATLQYCYCLFINGQLCAKTMQPISAMLNLEMCKQLYDLYFPSSLYISEKNIVDNKAQNNQQQQPQPQQIKLNEYFKDVDNISSCNQSILEFKLGQMYFQLNDQENALKCLKRAKQIREKTFDVFSDQVVETTLEVLRVYVEQEESGSVAKLCGQQATLINERYKQNNLFKTKSVAVLQLIIGVIYDNNGVLVSSLKFYQRALKTFQASRSNNYVRQLYITDKIKAIIARIKQIATQSTQLNKQSLCELNNLNGFLSISDVLKPFFTNSYYQNQQLNQTLNYSITSRLVYANGYLYNYELKEAEMRYEISQNIYKKQRIDECYGIVLEKLGLIKIYQKQFEKGIKLMKLAAEIHERYLQFPIKHKNIMRINLYILLFIASKTQQKQLLNQFDEIEKYIDKIYEEVHWNITPVAATNQNKFRVMLTQIGPKALYEVTELIHLIDLYYNLKKLIYENMKQPEKLQELANLYATKKLLQLSQKQRQNLLDKRTKCQVGQLAKISIIHKRNQIRIKSQNSIDIVKKIVEDPQKTGITQLTNSQIEISQDKTMKFPNSMIEETKDLGQSSNKILIDLRSIDQILNDQRRKQSNEFNQSKFRVQRNLSQYTDQNCSNLLQSQSDSISGQKQSQILQFSQTKQVQERQQNKITEFELQKSTNIQQGQQQILQPVIVQRGKHGKSTSQHATDQDRSKNSFIKINDEALSNKRRRTISQQSLSQGQLQKFKINPFEKSQKKK